MHRIIYHYDLPPQISCSSAALGTPTSAQSEVHPAPVIRANSSRNHHSQVTDDLTICDMLRLWSPSLTIWLVVEPTRLKNDGLRQLGWWLFPTEWKVIKAMFQSTNQLCCYQTNPSPSLLSQSWPTVLAVGPSVSSAPWFKSF